ncbi:MAG: LLM class flavin-dependent oxidoreductase [Dehalococcoidia bacterium]|nr:LLM class flavin-dependent oxidoreductase [Dehalococcoidia bacterium]
MRFGVFLAPHHPIGEHPTLQIRRDVELVEHLDRLGYDEFWCGEHHSGGWETIASPEMFLAAAGERTSRIMLGTGVVSLPYHHPFNVAQRMVQLDHLTRGRAMLGVGPGALPSDAVMLGIDPATQRERMDEALGVILRLLREDEPFSHESDWFELHDAALQIKPLQHDMPITVASSISPSGMRVAGKYGVGVISVASYSEEGLAALPTQWGFGETYAQEYGQEISRDNWRINIPFHISDSKEQALREVAAGIERWHNEYNVDVLGRPNTQKTEDGYALAKRMDETGGAIIGTPDQAVESIMRLQELSGGFGVLVGFAHDWATREQSLRSYELFARYVIPQVNGMLKSVEASAARVGGHKDELMERSSAAVLAAIRQHNATHPRDDKDDEKAAAQAHPGRTS